MLEYDIQEAEDLLTKNYKQAKASIEQTDKDLDFLKFVSFFFFFFKINFFLNYRDKITTTEVNMARVYNWDVKRRQTLKAQ